MPKQSPPPFIVAHMARTTFHVLRLKAGQNSNEAPAYVFECTTRSEAAAERVCRALTLIVEV